ncbi:hypothetical protein B0O44_102198 [Pedobacter nutrimenti]|jgi:hypothetical protein|uniref:Uncharacterized protein n=1 Tax=Pedobacter nutrimenti TaxID=1241337 RepID=A0A318UGW0_9SPHI|nr:hypothetical protein B0O44_102198 [Pedobacter nutrimenti]
MTSLSVKFYKNALAVNARQIRLVLWIIFKKINHRDNTVSFKSGHNKPLGHEIRLAEDEK